MGTRMKHYLSKSIDVFIAMSQTQKLSFHISYLQNVSIAFGPGPQFPLLQERSNGDYIKSPLISLVFDRFTQRCVGPRN